ncbi:hypothetical protein KFU94_20870 [Chloroflexi bacterium TSY]|nr:hypothetical protein [Chloroflexi bacterium TSY]
MNTKNIIKLFVAVALTLSVTFGSGVVADEIGLNATPSVSASSCSSNSGGGC